MLAGSKRNKKGILDPGKGPEQLPAKRKQDQ